jgi:hypothetical protein
VQYRKPRLDNAGLNNVMLELGGSLGLCERLRIGRHIGFEDGLFRAAVSKAGESDRVKLVIHPFGAFPGGPKTNLLSIPPLVPTIAARMNCCPPDRVSDIEQGTATSATR